MINPVSLSAACAKRIQILRGKPFFTNHHLGVMWNFNTNKFDKGCGRRFSRKSAFSFVGWTGQPSSEQRMALCRVPQTFSTADAKKKATLQLLPTPGICFGSMASSAARSGAF